MDALVALLTEDYHDSNWTDQEVGVAIGRGVPMIVVRLERDPYGLMGKGQALGGCSWNDPYNIAVKVFKLLYKRMVDKSRLFECALSAYSESESFADSAGTVEHLLTVFDTLTADQFAKLMETCKQNGQNRDSFAGRDKLRQLLKRWTGKDWTVVGDNLVQAGLSTDESDIWAEFF